MTKFIKTNLAVLLLSSVLTFLSSNNLYSATIPRKNNKQIIIAHRGAWKTSNLPQNSIASLIKSIDLKVAGSEFDVRMTLDDSLVINHDPTYCGLEIEKTTYNKLALCYLQNGEKIPTLNQYILHWKKKSTNTKLVCEIKPSEISSQRGITIAKKTIDLIKKMKVEKMVDYISFDYGIIKEISSLQPNSQTYYLTGDKTPLELKTDKIKGLDYNYNMFINNPNWIVEAKKLKLKLNAWTVNDPIVIKWLIANDFDYITTDEPELIINLLDKL